MVHDIETRRKKAKWKLRAMIATVAMCMMLMLYLVVNEPSEADLVVFHHASDKGISALRYPDYLVALLERKTGTEDYEKVEDFVLSYPFVDHDPQIDMSYFESSWGVPQFMQWDKRWGYLTYGEEVVATYGSGPMCLSMAGYHLTGLAQFYPDRVVDFAQKNGFWSEDGGSRESFIPVGGAALKLEVMELAPAESKIADYLQSGSLIIALMNEGEFADVTRYVLLWDYSGGKISLNDPDSLYNSGRQWSFAELEGEIRKLWVIRAGQQE